MAKAGDISKGDRVRWRTSQGKTTGRVIRIMTKPFSIKGTDLKASKDDPKVLVESEKTGAQAGHKPSALEKLTEKKTAAKGGDEKSKSKDSQSKDSKSKDSKSKDAKSKDAKSKDAKSKDSKSKDSKGSTSKDGKAKRG